MSKLTPAERTAKWRKENPEKDAINKARNQLLAAVAYLTRLG